MKRTILILTILACAFVGCDKRGGGLTRSVAAEILNKHLSEPSVSRLHFTKAGIQSAMQDGIIEPVWNVRYDFTKKGRTMVGPFVLMNTLGEYINKDMGDPDHSIDLKTPIRERLDKVTGITAIPEGGRQTVEYETAYILPAELQPLAKYLFKGRKLEATFQKFDDGWRIVNK